MEPVSREIPSIRFNGKIQDMASLFQGEIAFRCLSSWIIDRRWFASKSRIIQNGGFSDFMALSVTKKSPSQFFGGFLTLEYEIGEGDSYFLPLSFSQLPPETSFPIATLVFDDATGVLEDALMIPAFGREFLSFFTTQKLPPSIVVQKTPLFPDLFKSLKSDVFPKVLSGEQSNTSLLFDQSLILKCYRRPEKGGNCDLEMGIFLSESEEPLPVAPLLGGIGYAPEGEEGRILALLSGFIPNQGDAWNWLGKKGDAVIQRDGRGSARAVLDPDVRRVIEGIGDRTGLLHRVLSSDEHFRELVPEPVGEKDTGDLKKNIQDLVDELFPVDRVILRPWWPAAGPSPEELSRQIREWSSDLFSLVFLPPAPEGWGMKIRCHGDYHLGQVLVTLGLDVIVIDFEGEPSVPLPTRQGKRSPLADIAGMIRSFHYFSKTIFPGDDEKVLSKDLFDQMSGLFLKSYLGRMEGLTVLPSGPFFPLFLNLHLLRKALYELSYEMNNRPDWCRVPLAGILNLLEVG